MARKRSHDSVPARRRSTALSRVAVPGYGQVVRRITRLVGEPPRNIVRPVQAANDDQVGGARGTNRIGKRLHSHGVPDVLGSVGATSGQVLAQVTARPPAGP